MCADDVNPFFWDFQEESIMLGAMPTNPFGTVTVGSTGVTITKTSVTFKDQENYVYKLLEDTDEGTLALIYKNLYARGFRISSVDMAISKLKRSLAAPSS